MIRAIAVDDEVSCLDAISRLLVDLNDKVELIDTCRTVEEGYSKVTTLKPDLLFLDVEIFDKTGFDLLEKLGDFPVKVIFTTAHNGYAIRAFEVNAVHYLTKPLKLETLAEAIDRFVRSKRNEIASETKRIQDASKVFANPHEKLEQIVLNDQEKIEVVKLDELERLEAASNSCTLYYGESRRWVETKPLKFYSELLEPQGFIRTHKSFLINPKFFEKFDKKNSELTMKSGHKVPVSRRQIAMVKEKLGIKSSFLGF